MTSKQEHYELAEEYSRLAAAEFHRDHFQRANYYTQQAIVHAELSQGSSTVYHNTSVNNGAWGSQEDG